ncbi:MAG: hypothetical protein PF569_01775 [Candidatus Woesearchaeota archaeon]|jgi:hypothetical protein|nr:hypothetical protein [Candidatus Woesearchaeota archaeon]
MKYKHIKSKEILEIPGDIRDNIFPEWSVPDPDEWRPLIYTSEEGDDIYTGDRFFAVQKDYYQILPYCYSPLDNPKDWFIFSKEENAIKFSERNQVKYSEQDIIDAIEKVADICSWRIHYINLKFLYKQLNIKL